MDKNAQRRMRVNELLSHGNNIVTKLFARERGGFPVSRKFPATCVSHACRSLRVHDLLTLHDPTNIKHNAFALNLQQKTKIVEIFAVEELLIVLEECGLSVAFNVGLSFDVPSFSFFLNDLYSF